MKKITVSDDEIVEYYKKTGSPRKVAAHFGIGATSVERRLEKYGIARTGQRGLPRKLPPSIVDEYEGGMSMNQIARKYSVCLATVAGALNRSGVKSKPRGNAFKVLEPETIAEIVRLYTEENLSQEKIAKRLGTSQIMVSRHLRAQGIDTGRAKGADHGSWKGGRIRCGDNKAYFAVQVDRDDPMRVMAGSAGYVMEHRLVMAKNIGRPLERHETIHHINGDKADNRIENLQLRQGRHGAGVVHRCCDCGSTNIESTRLN